VIDLRSDTVTLPSPEMREVIYRAEVGDDVYGEDPSVNSLEALAARLLGKEAAMYVPTGTMGNLCAHMAHTQPGQELICGATCHTFLAEAGGAARVAGLSIRTIPQQRAELDPALVADAIRGDDIHYPPTGLIWVEQPSRGYVMPLDNLAALSTLARRYGVPLHIDGARIFHAAIALDVDVASIAAYADSVMFCVSKGLAAPVGSLLVGDAAFIRRARTARKILGGSMRQAGIIAAAGSYALEAMIDRLREDHLNAQRLAAGLRSLPGLVIDRDVIETNIFYCDLLLDTLSPRKLAALLRNAEVLISVPLGTSRRIRLVTHYGLTIRDIDHVIGAFSDIIRAEVP
jgi:threonine aldolase